MVTLCPVWDWDLFKATEASAGVTQQLCNNKASEVYFNLFDLYEVGEAQSIFKNSIKMEMLLKI